MSQTYRILSFNPSVPTMDLQPHPAAEMPTAEEDYAQLAESVELDHVQVPLVVMKEGESVFILDGCTRYKAAIKAGKKSLPCMFVECANPREFVLKNASRRRKCTTGQKVMCELELRKEEVISEANAANENRAKLLKKGNVSPSWSSDNDGGGVCRKIASDLKVSTKDVSYGLTLMMEIEEAEDGTKKESLLNARNSILAGSMGIRRWPSAVAGRETTKGKEKRIDWGGMGKESFRKLMNVMQHWDDISGKQKDEICEAFEAFLQSTLPKEMVKRIG